MSPAELKGVWNGPQHQEEIRAILRGDFKQFHLIVVPDLSVAGPVTSVGNSQGLIEAEGNALVGMVSYMDNDGVVHTATTNQADVPGLYVRFNHVDAPWLPIGRPLPTGGVSAPLSYALTIGRLWLRSSGNLTGNFFLLLCKGVCMYSSTGGPGIVNAYAPPTWTGLK